MLFTIAVLAVSLSLDALGVGLVYGLRAVKIPLLPKLIICAFSILYSFIALIAGKYLAVFFPAYAAKFIGISILILMGVWIILQSFIERKSSSTGKKSLKKSNETLFRFVIKSLGITVQVIKNPVEGDIDKSGSIDLSEAVLLGLALSVDAIGVGVGSALTGFHSMYIPFAIGLFQLAFLYLGTCIGGSFKARKAVNEKIISILPGMLLIFLALIRI